MFIKNRLEGKILLVSITHMYQFCGVKASGQVNGYSPNGYLTVMLVCLALVYGLIISSFLNP